jgi:hypothetical protein
MTVYKRYIGILYLSIVTGRIGRIEQPAAGVGAKSLN